MPAVSYEVLKDFLHRILLASGAPPEDSGIVAAHLARSDLVGHPSHGSIRLPQYVRMAREGLIVPGGPFRVIRETAAAATCSGGWNYGQVNCKKAFRLAMERAGESGMAAVALRESSHAGRLGEYVEDAAAAGFVGLITVNNHGASPTLAPQGGAAGRLCPEALAIGVPRRDFPIILDMSLSVIPEGTVRVARNEGAPVPADCLLDNRGNPTTDPRDFYTAPRGALLPLGGPAGHKGFGLAICLDILAGALSGAGCTLPGRVRLGNAAFILALRPGAFAGEDGFRSEVEALSEWIKSCPARPGHGEVRLPGEASARRAAARREGGIQVGQGTWAEILATARELGVAPPQMIG